VSAPLPCQVDLKAELKHLKRRFEEVAAENEALKRLLRELGSQALDAASRPAQRTGPLRGLMNGSGNAH
jgi:hypothetical protein